MERDDLYFKAVAAGAGMIASLAARNISTAVWRAARNEEPPSDPEAASISWGEAIAWSALTGLLVGVANLVARRAAASAMSSEVQVIEDP